MMPFLLSIYDYSGNWSRPYMDAGWRVLRWDGQIEGDILERFSTIHHFVNEENDGSVDGLLAAPPCTAFASSGARWWYEKDAQGSGPGEPFESETDYMVTLTRIVVLMVELFKPKFWALENPIGRIEKLCPELKPYRRLVFNPCDYGDPYTKRTVLWGRFNPNLKPCPVEPIEKSKMHLLPASKKRSKIRSETPVGFAQAFFKANNKPNVIAGLMPQGERMPEQMRLFN